MNLARLLPNRSVSIRLRLAALTTLVFVLMYVTLVVTDMKSQRDRLLERERVHAEALLDHLVQMPEFRSDLGAASERLAALSTIHAHGGAQISIALAGKDASTPEEVIGETLAERSVLLSGVAYVVRYRLDRSVITTLTRRTIGVHAAHGLVALVVLLALMDLVVRRRLVQPLERLVAAMHRMASGGWEVHVDGEFDREIGPLREEAERLGLQLGNQVELWIETDRRIGAAQRLRRFHDPLRAKLGRMGELISAMKSDSTAVRESISGLSTELEAIELLARREEQVLQASLGIADQAESPIVRKEPAARPSIES
ncbi:MAG: HAMP domain-containing protein [Thermoanaerobaculia bacterium]|nr:HAMP domain-containing protein [Thermoanaerobaculia bacterium]